VTDNATVIALRIVSVLRHKHAVTHDRTVRFAIRDNLKALAVHEHVPREVAPARMQQHSAAIKHVFIATDFVSRRREHALNRKRTLQAIVATIASAHQERSVTVTAEAVSVVLHRRAREQEEAASRIKAKRVFLGLVFAALRLHFHDRRSFATIVRFGTATLPRTGAATRRSCSWSRHGSSTATTRIFTSIFTAILAAIYTMLFMSATARVFLTEALIATKRVDDQTAATRAMITTGSVARVRISSRF
jgi:hypothetical protein